LVGFCKVGDGILVEKKRGGAKGHQTTYAQDD
jgi:hypothetical protein